MKRSWLELLVVLAVSRPCCLTHAQLSFIPDSDGRHVRVSADLPISLDPPECVGFEIEAFPPGPAVEWSTNVAVDYLVTFDLDLVVRATAAQSSGLSGQCIWVDMSAHTSLGYGIGIAPIGWAEASSDFGMRFQVANPTPYLLTWEMDQAFVTLASDMAGMIVESSPETWAGLEFAGVLQPGEVYMLWAQVSSSPASYPGEAHVLLEVIPEPTVLSLLVPGSLLLVLGRKWRLGSCRRRDELRAGG